MYIIRFNELKQVNQRASRVRQLLCNIIITMGGAKSAHAQRHWPATLSAGENPKIASSVLFDTRLPFGLCSAPKIFTAVADALQWIFRKWGVTWVAHYLDDYITIGSPRPGVCKQNLEVMLSCCQRLGVPVSVEKCAGPSSKIVFLGFELDTISMVVRLPEEKLQHIKLLVQKWMGRRACRKRDLESLLDHLQHAAAVIRPGRTFVRRLIELLSAFQNKEHWIRLSDVTRSDLCWWGHFMVGWNGIALMPSGAPLATPLMSDASGSWGYGAY